MQLNSCVPTVGYLCPHLRFLWLQTVNGCRSSEARTLTSSKYYLSGIVQSLIEHADLAFSLSPDNNNDIEKEIASLHMTRIPSGHGPRQVYLYIYLLMHKKFGEKRMHFFLQNTLMNILYVEYLHAQKYLNRLPYRSPAHAHTVVSIHEAHM